MVKISECSRCGKKLNFFTVIKETEKDKETCFCERCYKKWKEEKQNQEEQSERVLVNTNKIKPKLSDQEKAVDRTFLYIIAIILIIIGCLLLFSCELRFTPV